MKASKIMMHILATIVLVFLLLFIFLTIHVAADQAKYIYHPDRVISQTPAAAGLDFEDLSLKTEDGETIKAWFVPASENNIPANKTILFCHGNAGDIGDRIESLKTLNRLGLNTLIFDYRGFGKSSGKPSEQGTYIDATTCWDYLIDTRKINHENIIICGRSLGGAIACWLAATTNPAGLVLESTFASAPAMAHEMFPFLPVKLFCSYKYDNTATVSKIHCPLLVVHSKTDTVCPYKQGCRVFSAAKEPKQFVEIKGDHNAGGLNTNPNYQTELLKFITEIENNKKQEI